MGSSPVIPPPPPGFLLDSQGGPTTTYPSPPPGYVLDVPNTGTSAPKSGTDWQSIIGQILQQIGGVNPNPMLDFGKGGAVGMAKTGLGIGDLFAGQKPGTTAGALGVQSSNLPQQAGEATEGIMEFAAPGMAAAKAPLLARMAVEGGTNALSAAARGQNPLVGAAGGMLPGGTQALGATKAGRAVKGAVEQLGGRFVNSVIKPLQDSFRFGRNPGHTVTQEGIVANSQAGLLEKIIARKGEIGQEIERRLTTPEAAKQLIDIEDALQPIAQRINRAGRVGEKDLAKPLEELRSAIVERGTLLSPKDVHALKVEIGEATRWTNQAFDADLNQVKVQVYGRLNDLLDKAAPGIKEVQARYGGLLTAAKALERTMKIKERQSLMSLPDLMTGLGIGGTSFFGGGDPVESAAKGLAAVALKRGVTSPAVMTRLGAGAANAPSMAQVMELLKSLGLSQTRPPTPTQ